MSERLRLVVNPAAGRGRAMRVLPQVTAALAAAGARFEVRESASLEHAAWLAADGAADGPVVAVGGDGTAGALAGAVSRCGGTFGIVPAGRGNDLARMLGIPAGPAAVAAVLAGGRCRRVDLIAVRVGDQPEILAGGSVYLGLPALAGQIANTARLRAGPLAYPVAALRALARWTPVQFSVDGAGQPHDFPGFAVVAANSAYFGAGMRVAPQARIDDGLLDLVMMRTGPKLAFIRVLVTIRSGAHVRQPQVSLDRARELTITGGQDLLAAADGEALPGAAPLPAGVPIRIRAVPAALAVLTPAAAGPDPGPAAGSSVA